MSKSSAGSVIRLRGVRQNNLKNFDLDLPLKKLLVITGLSGSGKSSLAFDTLFAEGQRRYVETFSPYARQFFDRMDKPQVDSIEGILPAIAIEQRNSVRTTRSTVGTLTELCDYMKMLWPHISQLHCRQCGQPVRKDSPQAIWNSLCTEHGTRNTELVITFDLPLTEKLSLQESLALIAKQGYQHLLFDGRILRLGEFDSRTRSLTVVQDRLRLTSANRARFIEACEQAYHFGKGKLAIYFFQPREGPQPTPTGASSRNPFKFRSRREEALIEKSKIQDSRSKIDQSLLTSAPTIPIHALSPRRFSNRMHCAECDIEYREPSPALFSFNHPLGACPNCRGFGRIISIDYQRALPDRTKTIAGGVVKPWQVGHGLESQKDLMRMCRALEIPTDVPFQKLSEKWQRFVIEGDPDYGSDEEHQWPRAWYGVKGYFRWLETKAYKMHVRVLLSRYRAYTPCPTCRGRRFQPETLLYRIAVGADMRRRDLQSCLERSMLENQPAPTHVRKDQSLTLADFYQLPIRDALQFINELAERRPAKTPDPLALVLNEVRSRLGYLDEVGLGYLALDRPTRSLAGGEIERVSLTTCLGSRLVNTLFVLDEPSVGLHPRDTERLVRILEQLRNAGNTVVVVEHEASVMRAADQIIDLGPGHGAIGGEVVFQGTFGAILRNSRSLTGAYLSGQKCIEIPKRRPITVSRETFRFDGLRGQALGESLFMLNDAPAPRGSSRNACPVLKIAHASKHNLKDLSVEIPLQRFVCVTGVSGSGKTTLIREVLLPALQSKLNSSVSLGKSPDPFATEQASEEQDDEPSGRFAPAVQLEGSEWLGAVTLVDQSILGKTPRSNPAVYVGAFDDIREFFAQSEPARQRGLNASAFSFNSGQGQCERCRGAGFEKIEMQFLSDVFIRCPECNGRRYRWHILQVKVSPTRVEGRGPKVEGRKPVSALSRTRHSRPLSIADLLDSTVEEAVEFLAAFPESRPALRALQGLKLLQEVGLGYLKLGQPINTLSGGESQRLKLVRHLAASNVDVSSSGPDPLCSAHITHHASRITSQPPSPSTLFLFDEPTTGLHFDDVRVVLKVFQRLVDAGHSVVVIEHNLDVIKSADWIIDLGPEAGDQGGQLIAQGTPEDIARCPASHTGHALRQVLKERLPPCEFRSVADGLVAPESKGRGGRSMISEAP